MDLKSYVHRLYGRKDFDSCPFTKKEISELNQTNELLVYLPANLPMQELCNLFGIRANVDFENEKLIKNVMKKEDQWFITSSKEVPEFLYKSGKEASRIYEDEGIHGMDLRRYLAFAATFKDKFGYVPDKQYWTFLLSGSYDGSGVSIVGFDRNKVLSHHGWMRDFKAKFCGSRYVILPPRIEINDESKNLQRAYRGRNSIKGLEASLDRTS